MWVSPQADNRHRIISRAFHSNIVLLLLDMIMVQPVKLLINRHAGMCEIFNCHFLAAVLCLLLHEARSAQFPYSE